MCSFATLAHTRGVVVWTHAKANISTRGALREVDKALGYVGDIGAA
jgi:hypothetical protein